MKKKYLLFIFIFFLIILFLSPISGDDWGNYLVGKQGLHHMFGQALGMYFSWEGRIISRLLINILTYNKWLFNIIDSIAIISIIYTSYLIIKPNKNKNIIIILCILSILLMNIYTISQSITWVAGTITYLFPLSLILYYIYYIKDNKNNYFIIICIINLIVPMFVEHMGILIIIINIITLIYKYIKNKKIDKRYLTYLIISIISFITMFIAPGNNLRLEVENISFNELNIFNKIIYNILNFIYYTFIVNSFMLFLMIIVLFNLIKKNIKNNVLKYLLIILTSIYPLITIIVYNLNFIHINKYNILINRNI